MKDYDLKLRISPSDREFKKMIGDIAYQKKKEEVFEQYKHTCCGCDYSPNIAKALTMHVEKIDHENPLNSPCIVLCLACHATQHIDVAINNGWVELINSIYSQRRIISDCRSNSFINSASHDNTRYLKIDKFEFLQKIIDDTISPDTKAKVMFVSKFEWGDL